VGTRRETRTPRQERAKATVDALLEATGQVFEQRGLERTTTALVAARAGVSVGSLYQYFPDKQALLAAFFETRMSADLAFMQQVAARAVGASPLGVLRIVVEETVALYRRDRALFSGLAEVLPVIESVPEVRDGLERSVAAMAAHVRAHPALLGDRDPDLVARLMFHTLRSSLFQVLQHAPDKLDDPALPGLLYGALRGFLPPDAG
jgi:AcrR family transcriptional regulator